MCRRRLESFVSADDRQTLLTTEVAEKAAEDAGGNTRLTAKVATLM